MVWVGRRARDPLVEAGEDYLERLGHYGAVSLTRIKDASIDEELRAIEKHLDAASELVALDERGQQMSTSDMVLQVQRWAETHAKVTLLVGGADGLHPSLLTRAARRWGLSRLTLPHRLAQTILAEQLYRAHTVLRGEPYHRPSSPRG